MKEHEMQFDYLVIGSGIAGLYFALKVAPHGTVAIVTKKNKNDSNTNFAQGGIASVISEQDSFDLHIKDTLKAGAGICNKEAVEIMVHEGPERIRELISLGAKFSKDKEGHLELGCEGGHSRNRIVHTKDFTGKEIEESLLAAIAKERNISVFENHLIIDLITQEEKSISGSTKACKGAWILDDKGEIKLLKSKITLLAAGGCGQLYLHSTNPSIATGDGIALGYRAGAKVNDLEFIQFHPTSLFHPLANSFLISEALRGAGAIIRNKNGEDFTIKCNPLGSLAPRDIVARAIDAEMKKSGEQCVYLDATHIPGNNLKQNFPNIYNTCLRFGLDISKDPIPVVPAAHYMCGGLSVDLDGRTNVFGLYACGETACTGVHGANRLASNSLLEALVFSKRAAFHSINVLTRIRFNENQIPENKFIPRQISESEKIVLSNIRKLLRQTMTNFAGILRTNKGLIEAQKLISLLQKYFHTHFKETELSYELCELRNMLLVSQLIIESAMKRKDNIGLHFNVDYETSQPRIKLRNSLQ